VGGDGHQPLLVFVCIILPPEGDFAVGKVYDPVIGNGDAMRVAGQVMENMFRAAEWPFCVHHPIFTEQRPQKGVKRFLFGEPPHTAGDKLAESWREAVNFDGKRPSRISGGRAPTPDGVLAIGKSHAQRFSIPATWRPGSGILSAPHCRKTLHKNHGHSRLNNVNSPLPWRSRS
jgi:hypothetical protein